MKINLTKNQFEILMRTVDTGSSVYGILGDNVSDEYKKQSNDIEELRKYFLGFAKEFGIHEMAEDFMGTTIMSDEYSEMFHEAIEDYDDETFWHELEVRLGKRDFERTMTKVERKEIEENNGWLPERIHEIYEGWQKEFEENGVERLEVREN